MPKRRSMRARTAMLSAAAGAGLMAGAASAHHAIYLNYDPESLGAIEGVVEEVFWANPHVHFYLAVEDEGGAVVLWDVEGRNLNSMRQYGVSRGDIRVGDRFIVTGMVGRDGAPAMLADSVARDDGTVLWGQFTPGEAGYQQD